MTNIPFLELKRVNHVIEREIREAVSRVLASGWYVMGHECQAFEKELADDLSKQGGYAVGCNSGTDAIVLSLKAAGISAGDEVITVAHTAIPTAAAIVSIGAIPVFVDIDPDIWVMDPKNIRMAVTKKTKAIVPVHLYGNMVNLPELKEILVEMGRNDIAIIEDCAQAQGAFFQENQAGTLGDFGAYSFYPSKNIGALGDGGAVFTHNESSYQALCMYHNYGQKNRYHAAVAGGINSRLDDIQAGILRRKLQHLHLWNAHKSKLMRLYRELAKDLPVTFQKVTEKCRPGWHLCVIALEQGYDRDEIQDGLLENGLQTLIHYPTPVHQQPAFRAYYRGHLPHTEDLAKRILSLPLSYVMTEEEIWQIVDKMKYVFRHTKKGKKE